MVLLLIPVEDIDVLLLLLLRMHDGSTMMMKGVESW